MKCRWGGGLVMLCHYSSKDHTLKMTRRNKPSFQLGAEKCVVMLQVEVAVVSLAFRENQLDSPKKLMSFPCHHLNTRLGFGFMKVFTRGYFGLR